MFEFKLTHYPVGVQLTAEPRIDTVRRFREYPELAVGKRLSCRLACGNPGYEKMSRRKSLRSIL